VESGRLVQFILIQHIAWASSLVRVPAPVSCATGGPAPD
jgi:hypothetical protein